MRITKIIKDLKVKVVSDNIVRLTGPMACGKSTFGKVLAASFSMPLLQVQMCSAEGLDKKLHLEDNPRVVLLDGNFRKASIKKLMPVMKDWAEEGFVFIYVQYPDYVKK